MGFETSSGMGRLMSSAIKGITALKNAGKIAHQKNSYPDKRYNVVRLKLCI
jgi:hypothetical protein